MDTNLNSRFKELRGILGDTQKEFADKLSISQGAITDIERCKTGISSKVASKLFDLIKVNKDWFYTGEGVPIEGIVDNDLNRNLRRNNTDISTENYYSDTNVIGEADITNKIRYNVKRVSYLYQRLVDVRILQSEQLGIIHNFDGLGFIKNEEQELYLKLASLDVREIDGKSILGFGYETLNLKAKIAYNKDLENVIELFTNTFFKEFKVLYNALREETNFGRKVRKK